MPWEPGGGNGFESLEYFVAQQISFAMPPRYNFISTGVLEHGEFGQKGAEEGILMCQGQTGQFLSLNAGKIDFYLHLALFFHLSLPKIWHAKSTCKLLF